MRSDGALWYIVMCRDLRVMCVTYEQNEMKIGDKVYFSGGYRRLDPNHAVLDPCLAPACEPQIKAFAPDGARVFRSARKAFIISRPTH